jgi:hypothetical protein
MAKSNAKRINLQSAALMAVVLLVVVITGWALVVVSTTFQTPPSDFVTLPNSPISKSGVVVTFSNVTGVAGGRGVTVGVKGYLISATGGPVAGATVYMTYYLEGAYRTQVTTTDQSGYFEAHFPMNWTGWLPLTITYFGDVQHRGSTQLFSVTGENLALTPLRLSSEIVIIKCIVPSLN